MPNEAQAKAEKPLTIQEANALVHYAIEHCNGEPDWLVCVLSDAGPIITAVQRANAGEFVTQAGDGTVDVPFVTDHVPTAVQWLVSAHKTWDELKEAEVELPLEKRIDELVKLAQDWDAFIGLALDPKSPGTIEMFDDGVDALTIGNEMSNKIYSLAAEFSELHEAASEEPEAPPDPPGWHGNVYGPEAFPHPLCQRPNCPEQLYGSSSAPSCAMCAGLRSKDINEIEEKRQ